ncbi:MAG: MFS transporter [Rhodanobacteraceae bacterium]|nr:MAG: MFS transporter [Rhodanobacteraceae bacterium]
MLRTLRPIASLLLSTAFLLGSIGLLGTLIPLRGLQAGFSGTLLGGLAAVYYAGFLIGTVVIPPLVRRIGHIRAFAFGTGCAAGIALLHALAMWPWLWLLLRLTDGVMMVGLYTILESWLNAEAPPARRGVVFAIYMMVNSGALAMGQLLLRIPGEAFVLFSVVALLAMAAMLPVVLTRQAQPVPQTLPRLQLGRLFHLAPTAGVGALLSGLAMGAFYGLAPVYARDIGFDTTGVSTYMTLAILGGAALQWPLGWWSDHTDRRLALTAVGGAACLLALLVWFVGGRPFPATILIVLYSGMAFAIYPMVVAHLVDYLTQDELLAASSSVYLLYGAGSALGPLIVGIGFTLWGAKALPVWFALVTAALGIYAAYRYQAFRREQVAAHNFRPLLRTTAAAVRLSHPPAPHDANAPTGK